MCRSRQIAAGAATWAQPIYAPQVGSTRVEHAGIRTKIGNHTFRETGITAYLQNGGTLPTDRDAPTPRTTKLNDRTTDEITLDEIERIAI